MYNTGVTPLALGVGAGAALPFLDMSPFWLALATFALVACASAINRIVPRLIVGGQDWDPSKTRGEHRPGSTRIDPPLN
jgi:hypothetical protein